MKRRLISCMGEEKEAYIIERVRLGESEPFSWLVDRYKDMVYTICIKMLSVEADAEEAAQDVFVKAFISIRDFRGNSKFSTWLYRIAYNQCISVIRKKVKMIDLVDELPDREIEEGDLNGLDAISATERGRYLKMALEALPETDGVLVTLFYYEEMSLEEVAEVTGLSNSNVRTRLHRSRKKMQSLITAQLKSEVSSIL